MRIGRPARLASAVALAALFASPGAAWARPGPDAAYYERSFVLAAHARCDLFQPGVVAALTAAAAQARGTALRGGLNDAQAAAAAARAQARAAAVACADPDLARVAERVRAAFGHWARTARMAFPGDRAAWSADRGAYARPTWRLSQAGITGASPVTFGVAGGLDRPDRLAAVVSFIGRPRPYAARLAMRDAGVAPRPWLAGDGLAPASQRRVFMASGSAAAEASLLAAGRTAGEAWVFPDAAAEALSRLDPRESFVVEFLFRDDTVARARFEAGDFAAARAFLTLGPL